MHIPIKVGGKRVGYVDGDVFYKFLQPEHFLKIPPSIAFDITSLLDATQAGAIYVCIIDKARSREWWAPIDLIWKIGEYMNRGYGDQIRLGLQYWSEKRPKIQQMSFTEAA